MPGSRKWFVYTDDLGSNWGIFLDESNTEQLNAGVQDMPSPAITPNALPRNIKPRYILFGGAGQQPTIKCVALTPTIYANAISTGVSIDNPYGAGTLSQKQPKAEQRRVIRGDDTALLDGDAT